MKIFGIGLSRTGTTSLSIALIKLGFTVCHYPKPHKLLREAERYDALIDIPVILGYRELDLLYPRAKFILTTREMDSWLASCKRHLEKYHSRGKVPLIVRRAVFGCQDFHPSLFKEAYQFHEREVQRYFEDRKGKLLTMDICSGDGYEVLCPFLGVDTLNEAFPHSEGGNIHKYVG